MSKISGGSFENGATSASFLALYNWASRFGVRIHQRAIDPTLSDELSAEDRVILKDAHVSADEKQSRADAHLHAQSNADDKQTPEQARAHINAQMRKAFAAAQDKLARGDRAGALRQFGEGVLHPMQDATSPSHAGITPWGEGMSMWQIVKHIAMELIAPSPGQNLYQSTQRAYDWFESGQLPDGDLLTQ